MSVSLVTERCSEKYGRRLIGKTDMEDALKKLDKLTQEEARMIIAENLRATHVVDERVRGVTEQVLAVDDRVANVNDKVAEVIHGVQQVERSSSPMVASSILSMEPYVSFQKSKCERASTNGSPHRIRRLTIILRVVLITRKLQRGSSKEVFTTNGNPMVHSFGFMESVRPCPIFYPIVPDNVIL
jgi:hypothetical protein